MKFLMWPGVAVACALAAGCGRETGGTDEGKFEYSTGRVVQSAASRTNAVAADNTGRNSLDDSGRLTPLDQSNSETDRAMTQRIRRAIIANERLSTNAKNIKIITIHGKVTLRGPVENETEKNIIEMIVRDFGAVAVDDQLEIKAANQ